MFQWAILLWAATFLTVALIAAIFDFGDIAASAVGFAKVLFVLGMALFSVGLWLGSLRRGRLV